VRKKYTSGVTRRGFWAERDLSAIAIDSGCELCVTPNQQSNKPEFELLSCNFGPVDALSIICQLPVNLRVAQEFVLTFYITGE
jgi:hypothetical protein